MAAKVLLLGFLALLVWGYGRVVLGPARGAKIRRGRAPKGVRDDVAASGRRAVSPGVGRSPHEVLGVAPGASREEIRRAYHALVREYHPDRVAGAAAEIQRLAEERTAELNGAYRALMGE